VIDVSLLEFCLREDLNKTAPRVMVVLDPVKLVITNYPEDKEESLDAENNRKMIAQVLENCFSVNYT
jgi:glutaminyl-tRNA synthetase